MDCYISKPDAGYCSVCEKWTINKCKISQNFFCSDHKQAGCSMHKDYREPCKLFKTYTDDQKHHFVVATQPIEEGTVLLEELPLILASNQPLPVCLGCFTILDNLATPPCTKCGWPLCSEKCQNNPNHKPECYYISRVPHEAFVNSKLNFHMFHRCILILRCLYQKEHNPSIWEKINKLESRYSERISNQNYQTEKLELLNILYKCFGLQSEFSKEEIMKVYSIYLTNQQDAPITKPYPTAIYEISPMFEHNCRANCYKSIDSHGVLRIIAGVTIKTGGVRLNICYTDPLASTLNRQFNLAITKCLHCNCDRCKDATEWSTYISAIKCQNPICDGFVLPLTFVNPVFHWACRKCSFYVSHKRVVMLLTGIQKEMTTNNCVSMKKFIETNRKYLPEFHSYLLHTKYSMLAALGGLSPITMVTISIDDVMLKENLCQQFIELFNKIAPAEKKLMAYVYYNYQLCLEEINRRRVRAGENKLNYKTHLQTSQQLLNKIIKFTKFTSVFTPEGELLKAVKHKLGYVEEQLRMLEGSTQSFH